MLSPCRGTKVIELTSCYLYDYIQATVINNFFQVIRRSEHLIATYFTTDYLARIKKALVAGIPILR